MKNKLNYKISVIVPVYNVENYLDKCLSSLVNQTLKEIEIIVVNDGSPDNSQAIIDRYQKKYPQIIKSFSKPNGGLSDARNYGLDRAKGEYIAFLDSDDYVELNTYELLYNKVINNNYDIVACNLNYIFDKKIVKANSGLKNDVLTKDDLKKAITTIYPVAWNKLYKKCLFNDGLKFKKGVWFEDVEFLYRLLPSINSIGVIDDYLINYVQRPNTISQTFNRKLYDLLDNWNGIINFYKSHNLYNEYQKELEYCYVRYLYATFIKRSLNFSYPEYLKAVDQALDNVKKNFPDYRKNNYFKKKGIKGIYLICFNKILSILLYKTFNIKKLKGGNYEK